MRILLVDDHPLILDGIKAIISNEPDMQVVGTAADYDELDRLVAELHVEVLVIDLSLGNRPIAFDAIRELRSHFPEIKILVLSMYSDLAYVDNAMVSGANGYLPKSEASECLVPALRAIVAGVSYLSPKLTGSVAALSSSDPGKPGNLEHLTRRELEIFSLLGKGLTTREIAERMELELSTIGTHIEKIKRKIGCSSSVQLVHLASVWTFGK